MGSYVKYFSNSWCIQLIKHLEIIVIVKHTLAILNIRPFLLFLLFTCFEQWTIFQFEKFQYKM